MRVMDIELPSKDYSLARTGVSLRKWNALEKRWLVWEPVSQKAVEPGSAECTQNTD